MEQKIKNFDRNIEQLMNENAVAPPFGMWNRISAGLDAEALPVAAASPASFIPKRAVIGFMAAAIILGASLLTAYLVTNNSTEQKPIASQLTTPQITIPEQIIPEQLHLVAKAMPVAVSTPRKLSASMPILKHVEQKETATAQYKPINTEVAVPNQLIAQNTSASTDPYYFPPVDVITPETNKGGATVIEAKLDAPAEAETKVVEKKIKPASSPASEKRIMFKKKRSSGFTYGRLNRLRNSK